MVKDQSDKKGTKIEDLEKRIERLEARKDGISRRKAMAGGAGLLGLGVLTSSGVQPASAGNQQGGQIGTEADPLDFYGEDYFTKSQSGTPTPPSGYGAYVNDAGTPKFVDSTGTVTDLGSGGSGIFTDGDSDNIYEQTTGQGIAPVSVEHNNTYYADGSDSLSTILSNHGGEVIDLGGATYTVSSQQTIPANTTLQNGVIKATSGTYTNNTILYTDGNDNITIRNLEIDGNSVTGLNGMWILHSRNLRIINPYVHDTGNWAIALGERDVGEVEGEGPLVANPYLLNCTKGGILVQGNRDYVSVIGGNIHGGERGVVINGENTSVVGTHISQQTTAGIDIATNKIKVGEATINHCFEGITASGVERLRLSDCQMLVLNRHGVRFDGVRLSSVAGMNIGRPGNNTTGDAINLISSAGACELNNLRDNDCETYDSARATARYAINEADAGATGNIIRDNVGYQGATFSLNSTTHVSGNITP